MGVKIRERGGKLYLDIYHGGKRKWESLHLTLTNDKTQNKEIKRMAEICRSQREMQLLAGDWNIKDPVLSKKRFIEYLQQHSKDYSSPKTMKTVINHVRKYSGGEALLISQITPQWVNDFQDYLLGGQSGLSQMTAAHHSKMLRANLKKAVKENIIARDPCETIKRIKTPETDLIYLNMDEMRELARAKLEDGGEEIRKAFLFACHTGLRVCDIETIAWSDIEKYPAQIIKRQIKTKTVVIIPLSESAKKIIDCDAPHNAADKLFNLPNEYRHRTYGVLKRWAKAAGITKNIGWHTARRTFATHALENGADIYTVSKLLGHTSINQVVKYAKVTDKLRREAVAALPEIEM
jgi:site-specific recombinase XerD